VLETMDECLFDDEYAGFGVKFKVVTSLIEVICLQIISPSP